MKLILCPICQDIRKLLDEDTVYCKCRRSYGRYLDSLHAEIGGYAIPIGLLNSQLESAVHDYHNIPSASKGFEFTAFVIPKNCSTINRVQS